jgi:hypothetical protein
MAISEPKNNPNATINPKPCNSKSKTGIVNLTGPKKGITANMRTPEFIENKKYVKVKLYDEDKK